ncbi:MAG: hypothetical protein QM683_02970 [Lacrimispora sp.]
MRKLWTRLAVSGICGLAVFGSLTFLPQFSVEAEAAAYTGHGTVIICGERTGLQDTGEDAQPAVAEEEAGAAGWQQDQDGWKYRNSDGSFSKGCFVPADGIWYYFDQDGYMVRGWQQVGEAWYYFDSDGGRVTGSVVIGDRCYDFESDGKLNKRCYEAVQ